ncbi:MAG: CDP-diacylglycerol--glycerol-3-phosphate 3-phosphatidyltransferase [Candidatus Electryoneaceae bacterium]|nr:CDP-diacylglycerol--glycerol-3-phosphate 3-phosphatidyltransferase [Candidatus Electryoneaceae bacterium]
MNFTEIDQTSRTLWRRSRDRIGDVLGKDSPKGRITITIPNYLTLIRLAIVPIFLIGFFSDRWSLQVMATLLFAFGAITDLWDGKLARRLGQETEFGDFADPLVDKLLVLSGYWALIIREGFGSYWTIAIVCVSLISLREIALTLLRIWKISGGSSVKTSAWGKWKTGVQLTTLLFTMVFLNVKDWIAEAEVLPVVLELLDGQVFWVLVISLFLMSAAISLISGGLYMKGLSFKRSDDK